MSEQVFDFSVDLVKKAEDSINNLKTKVSNKKTNSREMILTYTQLRKILSSIVSIKNKLGIEQAKKMNFKELSSDIELEIRFLKTTLLYQAGRIEEGKGSFKTYPMKSFLEDSELILMIDSVGSSVEHFEFMCKYVEALVAFYKYRSAILSNGR